MEWSGGGALVAKLGSTEQPSPDSQDLVGLLTVGFEQLVTDLHVYMTWRKRYRGLVWVLESGGGRSSFIGQ